MCGTNANEERVTVRNVSRELESKERMENRSQRGERADDRGTK